MRPCHWLSGFALLMIFGSTSVIDLFAQSSQPTFSAPPTRAPASEPAGSQSRQPQAAGFQAPAFPSLQGSRDDTAGASPAATPADSRPAIESFPKSFPTRQPHDESTSTQILEPRSFSSNDNELRAPSNTLQANIRNDDPSRIRANDSMNPGQFQSPEQGANASFSLSPMAASSASGGAEGLKTVDSMPTRVPDWDQSSPATAGLTQPNDLRSADSDFQPKNSGLSSEADSNENDRGWAVRSQQSESSTFAESDLANASTPIRLESAPPVRLQDGVQSPLNQPGSSPSIQDSNIVPVQFQATQGANTPTWGVSTSPRSVRVSTAGDVNSEPVSLESFLSDFETSQQVQPLPGNPLTVADAIRQAPTHLRIPMLEAYWKTYQAWATYVDARDRDNRLKQLQRPGNNNDAAILNGAAAQAAADVTTAELRLFQSQSTLQSFMIGGSENLLLPLPTDSPLTQNYETHFDWYAQHNMIRPEHQRINDLLSRMHAVIEKQSSALILNQSALDGVLRGMQNGQSDLSTALVAIDQYFANRSRLMDAVVNYNLSISNYALTISPANKGPEQLSAMLIAPPAIGQESVIANNTNMSEISNRQAAVPASSTKGPLRDNSVLNPMAGQSNANSGLGGTGQIGIPVTPASNVNGQAPSGMQASRDFPAVNATLGQGNLRPRTNDEYGPLPQQDRTAAIGNASQPPSQTAEPAGQPAAANFGPAVDSGQVPAPRSFGDAAPQQPTPSQGSSFQPANNSDKSGLGPTPVNSNNANGFQGIQQPAAGNASQFDGFK